MDIDGPQNRARRRMESLLRHLSKRQKGEHNHSVSTDTKSCAFKSSCAVNPAGDESNNLPSKANAGTNGTYAYVSCGFSGGFDHQKSVSAGQTGVGSNSFPQAAVIL